MDDTRMTLLLEYVGVFVVFYNYSSCMLYSNLDLYRTYKNQFLAICILSNFETRA